MKKSTSDAASLDRPSDNGAGRARSRRFVPKLITIVVACMLAATAVPQVQADEKAEAKPLELRKIMRDLDRHMRGIADAVSRKDWIVIANIAPAIADHPQPSMAERMRILSFMGGDASAFRAYDGKTHHAARALEEAASRGDAPAVISSFAALKDSCAACHQRFQKPFVEHFYGKN